MSKKKVQISRKSSAPGSEAARDKWFVKKVQILRNNNLPQAAKLPGTSGLFKKVRSLKKKFCPRQRSCPGQVVCSKKRPISEKKSASGSEVAWDMWLVQKKVRFLRKVLPGPGLGPWARSRAGMGRARPSAHVILAWVYKSSVGLQVCHGSTSLAWVYQASVGLPWDYKSSLGLQTLVSLRKPSVTPHINLP